MNHRHWLTWRPCFFCQVRYIRALSAHYYIDSCWNIRLIFHQYTCCVQGQLRQILWPFLNCDQISSKMLYLHCVNGTVGPDKIGNKTYVLFLEHLCKSDLNLNDKKPPFLQTDEACSVKYSMSEKLKRA